MEWIAVTPAGIDFFPAGFAQTIRVNQSFFASSMRFSRETTGLIIPVSESSPMNKASPSGVFFRELRTAAANARSIHGSLSASHRPTFANTS